MNAFVLLYILTIATAEKFAVNEKSLEMDEDGCFVTEDACPIGFFESDEVANITSGSRGCCKCLDNCMTCVSKEVCSTCQDGYYLDTLSKDHLCQTCEDMDCKRCELDEQGNQMCTVCNNDFELNMDGICKYKYNSTYKTIVTLLILFIFVCAFSLIIFSFKFMYDLYGDKLLSEEELMQKLKED